MSDSRCADCGGFDFEWMYKCTKHGLEYCRGCSCPSCDEDAYDDDDGPCCNNILAHDAYDEVPCPVCGVKP